ncbi:hypothetical protein [Rhodovulum steppense]|uniref:Uncharacterized protein n=1 Tax=Rhodovulum steppense TaxID=540251 RepID=A0A4V2R4U7_9RHOB|nr:hypothetical protein [Rhodovulum steppense]TCM86114.1 hypothetical protein EV216_10579 [Rhodovulum steppense]
MVDGLGRLREMVRDIDPDHHPVDALWDACSVMIALAERHLGVRVWTANHRSAARALGKYLPRFETSLVTARKSLDHESSYGRRQSDRFRARARDYLDTADTDIDVFLDVTEPRDPEGPNFGMPEAYGEGIGLAGEALNALGMQGTGGKGNEGLEDYWKSETATRDDQRNAAAMMSGLHTDDAAAMDRLSGGADSAAGLWMAGDLGAKIAREIALLESLRGRTDKKAKRQRAGARMRLATLGVPGFVATLGKAEGGAMTALRGGESGNVPASAFFGRDAERCIDVGTDFKLVGDSVGILVSAVDSVTALVDMVRDGVKRWKKVEGNSRTASENAQAGFDTVHDLAGATNKVADTVSSVIKIYHQIAGGGQVATESVGAATEMARGVVNGVPVIPVIGLIKGVLDFLQQAIKLGRVAVAARKARQKAAELVVSGSEALLEAFTVTKEKFAKQIQRAIIEMIHAATSMTAGALTVSGMGAGLGMASSIAKLLQIGTRKFKQHRRDKAAGKLTNLRNPRLPRLMAKSSSAEPWKRRRAGLRPESAWAAPSTRTRAPRTRRSAIATRRWRSFARRMPNRNGSSRRWEFSATCSRSGTTRE